MNYMLSDPALATDVRMMACRIAELRRTLAVLAEVLEDLSQLALGTQIAVAIGHATLTFTDSQNGTRILRVATLTSSFELTTDFDSNISSNDKQALWKTVQPDCLLDDVVTVLRRIGIDE